MTNPIKKLLTSRIPGGDAQHYVLVLVYGCNKIMPVEHQHRIEGSVSNPLIPVHEWMILYQRECQRSDLLCEGGIQVSAIKRLSRLGKCGFQSSQVSYSLGASRLPDNQVMQLKHF